MRETARVNANLRVHCTRGTPKINFLLLLLILFRFSLVVAGNNNNV